MNLRTFSAHLFYLAFLVWIIQNSHFGWNSEPANESEFWADVLVVVIGGVAAGIYRSTPPNPKPKPAPEPQPDTHQHEHQHN